MIVVTLNILGGVEYFSQFIYIQHTVKTQDSHDVFLVCCICVQARVCAFRREFQIIIAQQGSKKAC